MISMDMREIADSPFCWDEQGRPLGQGFDNIAVPGHREALAMTIAGNTPVRTVNVCIPLSGFAELTGQDVEQLVTNLACLDSQADKATRPRRSTALDMAQRACAFQILSTSKNAPNETFFLEAKALELMALQLRQLDCLLGKTRPCQPGSYRTENIVYASEILKREMAAPPDIFTLARRAGLNHNQLIQGFRQMFGQTPFEYLRVMRLEKAREFIASHECNVTEAAFAVGYSNLSHFSKNFRNAFGITPKTLQKTTKKQHISAGTKESN